jgi:hypothetical protein
MKFYGMLGNAVVMVIIIGVFFLNTIPSFDDLNAIAVNSDASNFILNLSIPIIQAQGTSFINITAVIMTAIGSVSLTCTSYTI